MTESSITATGNADYEITVRVGGVEFFFSDDDAHTLIFELSKALDECDLMSARRGREDLAQMDADYRFYRGY